MAFVLKGTLNPNEGRMLIGGDTAPQLTTIVNSGVVQIGDKVEWNASGFIVGGAASTVTVEPVGIVVSVATSGGIAVDPDAGTQDTFTMPSGNQTTEKRYAIIDISNNTLYTVPLDTASSGTTGALLPGYSFDALGSDGAQVDESSSETSVTGAVSFHSWGVDPDNSLNVIVNMKQGAHHKLIS